MNSVFCNFYDVIKSCFCFDGKLSREKFWTYVVLLFFPFYMFAMPLFISAITLFAHFPSTNVWTKPTTYLLIMVSLSYIFLSLVYLALTLGPSARRLRDAGLTPWLLFLHIVFCPLGQIALLVLFCFPTGKIIEPKQSENVAPKAEVNKTSAVESK